MTQTFPFDAQQESHALIRQDSLTKPLGSLGVIEALAAQMAGFQHTKAPQARPCCTIIFAADHPVTKHGVSPYPSEVTAAMVANFSSGGAAAAVLSRETRQPLHVVDVGVNGGEGEFLPAGDIRVEDALSFELFEQCIEKGAQAVRQHASDARVLILGEMGIGNTTPAAALAACTLKANDPADLVGAGTGAKGTLLETKKVVVRDVVTRLGGETSPREILRRAGGRELVALYGAMREALGRKCILLIDGFIVTAVAALLVDETPSALKGMIFAHASNEHGHAALLNHLGARPLLDLGLRLGEGSGALLAYPLVESACSLHNTMATFESAQVPGKST